ncbi:nucleotidyltransferase domain-containing protein [Vibrio alginolyticus]|uniref:nucleotidyltransferase domain-containing protein n=1 Tax=Vibrio alginolyticus TaxID=663 RepID=UPI001BD3F797|nr:nucleotidyltransferase [Vibrio alginolyticus]ELC9556755.1 nucleotidyltransferase [Vibrio alginolyticus]MBS9842893.1 nucleotidyltransferase [Vibrio alginolyticus]
MAKDWEKSFAFWAQSPSATEQERCERVIKAINNAIKSSAKLNQRKILVFTQGSFRNRVNVRKESDVDVGVMLYEYFIAQYPDGKKNTDYGNYDASYSFSQFKDELEEALVDYFGRNAVTRGNKAFDIKASVSQVEADVVPLFEFRRYWEGGTYRAGVALFPDKGGSRIENYPERLVDYWPNTPLHYENGVAKNTSTSRRYKGMVRILKKLRVELESIGNENAKNLPGYLLECLAWNSPDWCYSHDNWVDRVQSVLRHVWQNTKETSLCNEWCEVDDIKYLFRASQPWSREQAHQLINDIWDHVGVKPI